MVEKLHNDPTYKQRFPQLKNLNHWVRSDKDLRYNCIAWVLGETNRPWWPNKLAGYFWPDDVPMAETVAAFDAVFALKGFVPCDTARREEGYEKIALFTDGQKPTHAAKQLPNGRWISKLGLLEDIEHSLSALDGLLYGRAVKFYRRPKP